MTTRRRTLGMAVSVASLAALASCQTVPAPAQEAITFIPVNGVGSVFLNAPITASSRALLLADIDKLIDAGARTIRLAINSPGGEITAAQDIVDYMVRSNANRGVTFECYDVGMVASAATYVFLNAQRRYARANSGFLFHAAGMVSTGPVSAERLREEATKIDAYERAVRATLKARTRLTDAAIDVYLHRTVVLNADDAQRDGVVDAIANFPTSPGGRVITIAVRPVARSAQPAAIPAVSGS